MTHTTLGQTEYLLHQGGDRLLYIKIGADGSVRGYEDKYITIADRAAKMGCSVMIAGNVSSLPPQQNISQDMQVLADSFPHIKEIYAFGHSLGGYLLACFGYQYPIIRRILAINSPLTPYRELLPTGIARFQGERMIFLFGGNSPEADRISDIFPCHNTRATYAIIPGADHHFTDMLSTFTDLPFTYLM